MPPQPLEGVDFGLGEQTVGKLLQGTEQSLGRLAGGGRYFHVAPPFSRELLLKPLREHLREAPATAAIEVLLERHRAVAAAKLPSQLCPPRVQRAAEEGGLRHARRAP